MEPDPRTVRRLAPGVGQTLRVFADHVTIKAASADTGGAYALFEVETPPGQGMPRHLQRHDDEAFFVLEGIYAFHLEEQTVEFGAGGYVFVPRETRHGYTNIGIGFARLLLLVSPGDIQEQFFAEIGVSVISPLRSIERGSGDITRIAMVAEKYGVEFLPTQASTDYSPDHA